MVKKKRNSEEIKQDILKYLSKQTFPRTTGQVAEAVRLIWYRASDYLKELEEEEKVYHEKIGRQNQWCLMKYYEPWKKKLKTQ